MSNKNKIIEKIIKDAQAEANKKIVAAKNEGKQIITDAKKEASSLVWEAQKRLPGWQKDLIEKGEIVADIEAKKIILQKKKQIIDDTIGLSFAELLKMPKEPYLKLIEKVIVKYAEDNDTVIISKNDEKRITKTWLNEVAKKAKKKLTLGKATDSFKLGVILSNDNCDTDLTFDSEMKKLKVELEAEIAKIIFEEGK